MIVWPFILFAYQLDLALACVDAWQHAPAAPRLEPEVHPVAIALRRLDRQRQHRAGAPSNQA